MLETSTFRENITLISIVLLFQAEFFYSICYSNVILLNKQLQLVKTTHTTSPLNPIMTNMPYLIVFFMSTFFLKSANGVAIFSLVFILLYLLKVNKVLQLINVNIVNFNIIYLILPTFFTFFYFLQVVDSFLTFFFFIELYGVLYYFFFLSSYSFTNQTIIKYKNGLLLLLWNNFLTTFFLGLGTFFIIKSYGSSKFEEILIVTQVSLSIYIFLVGLFWKIGLPVFHFFKLEVYKYLLKENVFLFSILTTLTNLVIVYFCVLQPLVFNTIYLHNFLFILLIFGILLAVVNLKLTNLLYFLAFSGIFTMTTIFVVFIIKNVCTKPKISILYATTCNTAIKVST